MLICYAHLIVRKHLPCGVIVILAGVLLGVGCKGGSDAKAEAPSLGIPVGEYDLFASLIRNIDAALERVLVISGGPNSACSGSRNIFPLCLGGQLQTDASTILCSFRVSDVLYRILPGYDASS